MGVLRVPPTAGSVDSACSPGVFSSASSRSSFCAWIFWKEIEAGDGSAGHLTSLITGVEEERLTFSTLVQVSPARRGQTPGSRQPSAWLGGAGSRRLGLISPPWGAKLLPPTA